MRMLSTTSSRTRLTRHGFTLTETLVVVIILAVIVTFAIPAVGTQMATTRADRAAYIISVDLESAFSLAARQRRPVTWTVDPSTKRYTIRTRGAGTILLDRYMSGNDSPYGLSALSMNPGSITVFPNGMTSGAATISLSVGTQSRAVRMSRAGQIRVGMP